MFNNIVKDSLKKRQQKVFEKSFIGIGQYTLQKQFCDLSLPSRQVVQDVK